MNDRVRTRRMVFVALGVVAILVLGGVIAFVTLRDTGDDTASPEVALENGLPVEPEAPAQPELGTKRGEPSGEAALVLPSPPPTSAAAWADLTERADAEGSVRVIVTLDLTAQPEGLLTSRARADQRRRIKSAGRRVLSSVSAEATAVDRFKAVPIIALEATPEVLADLRASPAVASVVEDVARAIPPWGVAEADGAAAADGLNDWWDLDQAGINESIEGGYDGAGQTVAILDSGVQSDHPWLAGRVVGEACFSYDRNCPNGETEQLGAGAGTPCTYAPDNCAHGTHVAHTAAGKYGVARGAKILAVQVFSRATREECKKFGYDTEACALSWDSDQLRALQHVYSLRGTHKIAAVNISIGGGRYPAYCDVETVSSFASWARTLAAVGIATVVSAGNDGHIDALGSPACNSTAVSVGATTLVNGADAVWVSSNSASTLDLLAPGVHICSAVPGTQATPEASECWQGTSMAAPHVAGAFAVLRELKPAVSATTVETEQNMLSASGAQVTDARNGLMRSRIDVWDALVALSNS